jgi:hypothetical protein
MARWARANRLPSGYPENNKVQIVISFCLPSRIFEAGEYTGTAVACSLVVPEGRQSYEPKYASLIRHPEIKIYSSRSNFCVL